MDLVDPLGCSKDKRWEEFALEVPRLTSFIPSLRRSPDAVQLHGTASS